MSKKTGFVPKTFRDAGTEETFEGGKEHSFDPGPYENYRAAGLIAEPDDKSKGKSAGDGKSGS